MSKNVKNSEVKRSISQPDKGAEVNSPKKKKPITKVGFKKLKHKGIK